jgi:tetratricopeptide (TPR) repeat protein
MSPSQPHLSPEEQEQIQQTIEMFEVIVQANPRDSQSMEILRDAYLRLGMKSEMLGISRKLAATYVELTQYSQAMLEYESILKHEPDNPEIIVALGDVEERMTNAAKHAPALAEAPAINLDFRAVVVSETGTLMATASTMRPDGVKFGSVNAARLEEVAATLVDDGNDALAKFLILHRLAPEEVVQMALERVHKRHETLQPDQLGVSLIDEVVQRGELNLEALLCGILERTKFAYIPLEYYEIDRQMVKMLPETITLNRLIVPFDVMSRTLMIATANPFDALGKQAVHQLLDYNIQWHLSSPAAIYKALGEAYKVPTPRGAGVAAMGSAELPVPQLHVAATPEPIQPVEELAPNAPLPDTSAFRLK